MPKPCFPTSCQKYMESLKNIQNDIYSHKNC